MIAENTVDVWRFGLDHDLSELAAATLTPPELQRARDILSPLARRRFMAGRVQVRRVLSRYCNLNPSRVPIGQNRFGKPYL
jgi:4'-phosphopantetheinyl transferase